MSYFPVAELKERYGIGKQAELNRRKHLGIVPQKIDGTYVIGEEQLCLLDRLDEFLTSKPGTKMTDFTDAYSGTSGNSGPIKFSVSSRVAGSTVSTGNSGTSGNSEPSVSSGTSGTSEPSIPSGSNGNSGTSGTSRSNGSTVMDATLVDSSSHLALPEEEGEPTDIVQLVESIARAITPPNPIAHWERLAWLADNKIMISTNEVQALIGTKPKGKQWSRGSFSFTRSGKLGTQYGWVVSKIN